MPVAKKGERFGGRSKGTPNRLTVERQLEAKRQIDNARRTNAKLGKEMLDELMMLSRAAMGRFQEITPEMVARAAAEGRTIRSAPGDWEKFGEWFDRCAYCAKELTKYQSPQVRAVVLREEIVPQAPPSPAPQTIDLVATEASPAEITATYMRLIRAPKNDAPQS